MLKEIGAALQWSVTLGARFFQVFPLGTLAAITLTFLAQLALIASFLLPIKIVMIMSSGNIPNIFPPVIFQLGEQLLISITTALAVGAFVFSSIATKIIENLAIKGVRRIQQHTEKLALFENQETLAKNAILKFSMALASVLFIILGLTLLTVFYWELAAVATVFVSACIALYCLIWTKAPDRWQAIQANFPKHLNTLSNIGFLTLFLTIVIDYMIATIPGFLIVLLCIILSRQLFTQIATAIISIHFLSIHQHKLKALTFESHAINHTNTQVSGAVGEFLSNHELKKKLTSRVRELTESSSPALTFQWLDTGLQNILHFIVEPELQDKRKYLIKIFDTNKSAKARHEATLLLEAPIGFPSPKLSSVDTICGFPLHIFDITDYNHNPGTLDVGAIDEFQAGLIEATPGPELINQYKRSRSMIWDRIDIPTIEKLQAIATDEEKVVIKRFLSHLSSLRENLESIPLSVHNPTRNPNLYLVNEHGSAVNIYWGEWQLDPVGTTLLINNAKGTSLKLAKTKISDGKYNFPFTVDQITFTAKLGQLENALQKQHYRIALNTISSLVHAKPA